MSAAPAPAGMTIAEIAAAGGTEQGNVCSSHSVAYLSLECGGLPRLIHNFPG
jgi:hypothetical protein